MIIFFSFLSLVWRERDAKGPPPPRVGTTSASQPASPGILHTTAVKIINSAMQTSILNTSSLLKALAYISIQGVHIPLKVTASGGEEEDSRGEREREIRSPLALTLTSHSIVSSTRSFVRSFTSCTWRLTRGGTRFSLCLSVCLSGALLTSAKMWMREGVGGCVHIRIRRVEGGRWFDTTLQSSVSAAVAIIIERNACDTTIQYKIQCKHPPSPSSILYLYLKLINQKVEQDLTTFLIY